MQTSVFDSVLMNIQVSEEHSLPVKFLATVWHRRETIQLCEHLRAL